MNQPHFRKIFHRRHIGRFQESMARFQVNASIEPFDISPLLCQQFPDFISSPGVHIENHPAKQRRIPPIKKRLMPRYARAHVVPEQFTQIQRARPRAGQRKQDRLLRGSICPRTHENNGLNRLVNAHHFHGFQHFGCEQSGASPIKYRKPETCIDPFRPSPWM